MFILVKNIQRNTYPAVKNKASIGRSMGKVEKVDNDRLGRAEESLESKNHIYLSKDKVMEMVHLFAVGLCPG